MSGIVPTTSRNEYRRGWCERNPGKVREYNRRRWEKVKADPEMYERLPAKNRASYQRNRDARLARATAVRDPKRQRAARLRLNYGITVEGYDAMLSAQDGRCGACRRHETLTARGRVMRLAVDHDHATGKVRGLLCAACNMALGKLDEDPARIRRLADYLEAHE